MPAARPVPACAIRARSRPHWALAKSCSGTPQVSTTFGGELLSLVVCQAALNVYRSTNYIEHIASLGRALREGVNAAASAAKAPLRVLGYDSIPLFSFDPDPARHSPMMRNCKHKWPSAACCCAAT